jgi:hypothetical protein
MESKQVRERETVCDFCGGGEHEIPAPGQACSCPCHLSDDEAVRQLAAIADKAKAYWDRFRPEAAYSPQLQSLIDWLARRASLLSSRRRADNDLR